MNRQKSVTWKELFSDWPRIILDKDEIENAYSVLKSEGEASDQPPQAKTHIENLSYELTNGDKRLRFFATKHPLELGDINIRQFEILEQRFTASPPQLVLIEGLTDFEYPFTREQALAHGEQTFMCYLVQQHNLTVPEGEKPIFIESGDASVNTEPDDAVRDRAIVENAAAKFSQFDKIDIVFGSGHAIRQKKAWEEFFDIS